MKTLFFLALGVLVSLPASAVVYNASLSQSTIIVSEVAELQLTLSAPSVPESDISFVYTLPSSVNLVSAAALSSSCGTIEYAIEPTNPGDTPDPDLHPEVVRFSVGRLAIGEACSVKLLLRPDALGSSTLNLPVVNFTAGSESHPPLTLNVVTRDTSFSVQISESSVNVGDRVRITYTFDQQSSSGLTTFFGSSNLPSQLKIASPPMLEDGCSNAPGVTSSDTSIVGNSISFNVQALLSSFNCPVSFEAIAVSKGEALIEAQASVASVNFLDVRALNIEQQALVFTQDIVGVGIPGEESRLDFRIQNPSKSNATGISFTQNLDASLTGLVAQTAGLANVCGSGSSLSGSGSLSLAGGALAAGEECRFSVPLDIPAAAVAGTYDLQSSNLSAQVNSLAELVDASKTVLSVSHGVTGEMTFDKTVVSFPDTTMLDFVLNNSSPVAAADDISFTIEVPAGLVVTAPVSSAFCGAASAINISDLTSVPPPGSNTHTVSIFSANLIAGGACQFSLEVTPPVSSSSRLIEFDVSQISTEISGVETQQTMAGASFLIASSPRVEARVSAAQPLLPGSQFRLEVDLFNDAQEAAEDRDVLETYSSVGFTLDLESVVTGMDGQLIDSETSCTGGSLSSGLLEVSGLNLPVGESCRLVAEITIPQAAVPALVSLTSSPISAVNDVQSAPVQGAPFSVDINFSSLSSKMMVDGYRAEPGDEITLTFQFENNPDNLSLSNGLFSVNLPTALSGLTVAAGGLPSEPCGVGSTASLTGIRLDIAGMSLAPGESCSFDVNLQVPAGARPGRYQLTSGEVVFVRNGINSIYSAMTAPFIIDETGSAALPKDVTAVDVAQTSSNTDSDGDGVSNGDEGAIGDGDGNNDGVPDAAQSQVLTALNAGTGKLISVEASGACDRVENVSASTIGGSPIAIFEGVVSFELPCSSANVTLFYEALPEAADLRLMKYGKKAPDFSGPDVWYEMPNMVIDRSKNSVSFVLTDGGLGDNTGVDGVIIDPVGLGIASSAGNGGNGIPTLNLFALAGLVFGMVFIVRRKRRSFNLRR